MREYTVDRLRKRFVSEGTGPVLNRKARAEGVLVHPRA
jgi:hypothetical protein